MAQRSVSRARPVVVLAGISVTASVAMAVGVWGSRLWAGNSFVTACVVTALVASVGGLVVVPLLSRFAARGNGRSSAD
ncbi:hypothetical protein ACGFI4_15430 [Micromonospora carbonacea]|uniref:Uncharacterized protein n=1 Tax=Micromonospora carbonacea TaxID=47853 RepID=A0A7H8XKV8_9ACTN|nr:MULTISPECIES: hypothetical protein [Micromonospora]MBB5826852.1 membrane protein YdbS with pleckstrin-like domain [Micromonospora carbonacea]MDG4819207.1 hypothetical protein [Micromonospora sp. WMMD956]QLD25300.1 hypothetical protein HXZ27_14660 [Micromonospora carbonacea]WFE55672.1 hypothetical protein O7633_01830 [Micromonospora sp. WMMD712]